MASARTRTAAAPLPRGDGRRTPTGFRFELSGGAPCLDLVNTVDARPRPTRRDNLESYDDLVGWGEQARLLDRAAATALRRAAARSPAQAARALERTKALREVLFGVFSALTRGEPPPADAQATLNRALGEAYARLELVPSGPAFRAHFAGEPSDLERLRFPVLQSACELLTAPAELERLRLCAADNCDWLFLDRSKNRSRRWCDMKVCGNRDKVRRHYRRVRR